MGPTSHEQQHQHAPVSQDRRGRVGGVASLGIGEMQERPIRMKSNAIVIGTCIRLYQCIRMNH